MRPSISSRFAAVLRTGFAIAIVFAITGCLKTMQPLDPAGLTISSKTASNLKAHVDFLARPELSGRKPGTEGNRLAADWIAAAFREAGLVPFASMPAFRQTISADHGDNIIGYRPANGPSLGWILIGAHYDHLGGEYLGADDNASAVAILLELARSFLSLSNYSVVFAAFNTEERPYFGTPQMGSQFLIAHLPPEIGKLDALQAVVIMDLMGGVQWRPIQNVVFAAGAEKSPGLYRRVKEAMNHSQSNLSDGTQTSAATGLTVLPVGMHLIEEIPKRGHHPVSDYDGFRNRHVPYLFLSSARTPRYHTPNDRADTLHYERMAATVQWLNRLLHSMDADHQKYTFETDRLEWTDEVDTFRRVTGYAVNEATLVPGTSRMSLRKLWQDAKWLNSLDGSTPTQNDLERLEQVSIRFQCLLADYVGCFLF